MPSYDANNRLTSETKDNVTTTYTYDNNGNTIGKATGTTLDVYSYNLYNQLTGNVINNVSATYTYNAKGIRTSKTVGTDVTSFILDGGNVIAEVKGTEVVDYVRGINLICTGESYYLYNAHGDVVSLTSTSGVVTKTYDYDAFGNETNPSSTDANPFRYCGEYYDTETGTYYLRARYYDPSLGRFGTEDPAHDGLNWYTYCGGNPVLFVDPSGMRTEEEATKIIEDHIEEIKAAAEEFGVDPLYVMLVIFAEQNINVNFVDDLTDILLGNLGIDTSIGIAQVKISTAEIVEKEGYISRELTASGKEISFVKALEKDSVRYAAAYLKSIIDEWKGEYPQIDEDIGILATLYNIGTEKNKPHPNPETNDFGDFAKENIGKMESILRKYLPMQPMQPMPPLSAKYPMSTRTRGIQVCEIR